MTQPDFQPTLTGPTVIVGPVRDHAKIGGVKRDGLLIRKLSVDWPYFIFEIGKGRYEEGGRALVA